MDSILSVKNLKKYYGKVKAVDGISFEMYPGEVVGLIGPNGAGKSTTLKTIMGLLRKTEGEIKICGYDYI
jgi:ABC-type multidrug transport system ATPase subunit